MQLESLGCLGDRREIWYGNRDSRANGSSNRLSQERDRIKVTKLTGTEDRHQDCLRLRAAHRSIPIGVLAHDHRKSHLSFGVIVVCGNTRVQEKSQQFRAMLVQTLRQALAIPILVGA